MASISLAICLTCAVAPAAYAADNVDLISSKVAVSAQEDSDGTTSVEYVKTAYDNIPKPDTITTVKLADIGNGKVKVSWNKPSLNGARFNGYVVFYSYNANMKNPEYDLTNLHESSKNDPDKTSLVLSNIQAGKTLYVQVRVNALYRVSDQNEIANGDLSAIRSIKTSKAATPKPRAITSLKLISKKAGKVDASWKASKVRGLTKQTYTVRYSYKKNMAGAKAKTTTKKSLVIKKLKHNKKVYVQVRTNAKYGSKTLHSKWSTKKAVTVK